jgi:glucose-6-phosphate 1-dehydrogenase
MPASTSALAQFLVFGGGGDLASRKLIPALARLRRAGQPKADVQVIGVGRREMSDDAFRAELRQAMPEALAEPFAALAKDIHYRSADASDTESLRRLRQALEALAGDRETGRLCYLALKPDLFGPAIVHLRESGIVARQDQTESAFRRVVIEKPFGHDLASARALNDTVQSVLNEHQVFRIDHYLGKETVQNLLGLRFHNAIFEPIWNRRHVELVQITVAETVGMEAGRAGYYDGTGALRDMLQNHMLQILALVAMEPPASLEAEALRNHKVDVLRALQPPDREDVERHSVRARYAAGKVNGTEVRGYLEESGVAPDSSTETYVAVRAEIANWRWDGVPFLLRHGKRLGKRMTEVQVQFRLPPVQLFNRPAGVSDAELQRLLRTGSICLIRPNVLTIGIQPEETIKLSFGVKEPGAQMTMAPASMTFDYRQRFGAEPPEAYDRLLLDAMNGDASLFLRADEIEASWRFADAIRAGWAEGGVPMLEYAAGTWGPEQATELFHGCEGGWSRG